MRWLSRRWLYNIPRSLKTEGLRPLGRLAFADHARQAVQRIRLSLAQAQNPEAVETSRQQTQLDFRDDAVRVIVVAVLTTLATASSGESPQRSVSTKSASALITIARSRFN